MTTKKILSIAMLALMVVSIATVYPMPVVQSADQPLFHITIIAPGNANILRRQWALIIQNSFQTAGIDAQVVFLSWASVYDRALTPAPENVGKTWDQGGFDALLLGWTPGSPSTPYLGTFQTYYSLNTPPNNNYMLWNNATSDALLKQCLATGYNAQGEALYKQWQQVQYQDVPASQLFFTSAVFTASNSLNFHGYEWVFDNLGSVPQFVTGASSAVIATTGQLLALNPMLSNSWYDTIAFSPIYDTLYFTDSNFQSQPDLATSYNVSTDGHVYTYTLRQGVQWQDGVNFTADDVVFSYLAQLNPQSGSQQSATLSGYIGDDITFKWLNGTTTRLVLNLTSGEGFYPANATTIGTRIGMVEAIDNYTVQITIPNFSGLTLPAATFHPEGEPLVILPMHVLDNIPFADWQNHPFNTGSGTYTANNQTWSGPIGTGPYEFVSYDATNGLINETKYNGYWNATGLESAGLFTMQNFYVRYIVEKDGAVAALKNSEVQMLDQNYQLQQDYLAGNLNFATNYVLQGSGIQQLGYNLRSPIWGTGTATPAGQANASNAAEAARDVRLAFDYLIPRTLIVQNLEGGLGAPAAVHVNPLSPYYDTSLTPREYNLTMAQYYLSQAGYNVNTAITPTTTTVNQPIAFSGTFTVDNEYSSSEGGIMFLLQQSSDNINWTSIALGTTSVNGSYSISYTPNSTGLQYFRILLTGIGAATAASNNFTTPDYPYYQLGATDQPTLTSSVLAYNVVAATDMWTYVAYAIIAIVIIAIIIAIAARSRKPKPKTP